MFKINIIIFNSPIKKALYGRTPSSFACQANESGLLDSDEVRVVGEEQKGEGEKHFRNDCGHRRKYRDVLSSAFRMQVYNRGRDEGWQSSGVRDERKG
jgi:hypothetical protein